MSLGEFDDLRDLVLESASVQLAEAAPENCFYPGGWVAGNWQQQAMRGDLNLLLLYYPRIAVHDPIADFYFDDHDRLPKMRPLRERNGQMSIEAGVAVWGKGASYGEMRGSVDGVRDYMATVITYMFELAPLIHESVIVPRAQWPVILERQNSIMASVRHDVSSADMQELVRLSAENGDPVTVWDFLRGFGVVPGAGVRISDLPWRSQYEFFYLAKSLAFADQTGSVYVPPTESDLKMLRLKSEALGKRLSAIAKQPLDLLGEVARVLIPDLQLKADQAVKIRNNDENFDDWRRLLSRIARDSRHDSPEELHQRVEDELLPVVRRVEVKTKRSTVLKETVKDQAATAVFTGGPAITSAVLSGGNPLVIGANVVTGGVLQWIWKAYRPPKLGGADTVIASIIRK
jgi:hypothetical protein